MYPHWVLLWKKVPWFQLMALLSDSNWLERLYVVYNITSMALNFLSSCSPVVWVREKSRQSNLVALRSWKVARFANKVVNYFNTWSNLKEKLGISSLETPMEFVCGWIETENYLGLRNYFIGEVFPFPNQLEL